MLKSIAFIPDGNRRYGKKAGISLLEAYALGFERAEQVFDWCLEIPTMKTATIYSLSTENLNRSGEELTILLKLYEKYFYDLAENKKIHRNEVKVRVIGQSTRFNGLSEAAAALENATKDYGRYTVNIALAYGGRWELLEAVRKLMEQHVNPQTLNEQNFSQYLAEPDDVDLLIRTGSTQRLSNFLPWQTAYSELYFSEKLWPEFDKKEFEKAVAFYNSTQRNFGK
jgi:undecaprenyl diphosphate synthase